MNQYSTLSAFDAHNAGLLTAIRVRQSGMLPPESLATEEERRAWKDGVLEGLEIRSHFETAPRPSVRPVRA